ncbi:MAG: 2-amino-4-hydroxy-6-hydroxymethyldihydropteridine diphosphokinase [Anaeromyxobacteraceae bacterium]
MRAYVAVGSNLGDRWARLGAAARGIAALPRTAVVGASRVFDTAPVGPPQPRYLNAVLALETGLPPEALLRMLRSVEARALRRRDQRWGARTLDLDLLLHGEAVLRTPALVLPHPGLTARRFVLAPLADLAPGLVVPGTGLDVAALLARAPGAADEVVPVGRYPR